ncbi:MAG: hypothetical protein HYS07_04470 [Chlamydiae bacterium]|nr:hypothetical protein [Chlamydiota bacterium]MBI3277454.1 hypothetical protein [Chlamydiota bacterium]
MKNFIQRFLFLVVIYFQFVPFSIQASSFFETLFKEGQKAYTEGDFKKALSNFKKIEKGGFKSSEMDYNMGNCYFKLGKLGRAILFYERALRSSRRDQEIRLNLEFAHNLLQDKMAPSPHMFLLQPFEWIAKRLSLWELVLINVIFGWFILMNLSFIFLIPKVRSKLWMTAGVLALFQVIFLTSWYIVRRDEVMHPKGIILIKEVQVLSGPGKSFPVSSKIHEGLKVMIEAQQGEWSKIELPNGWIGWVKSKSYGRI